MKVLNKLDLSGNEILNRIEHKVDSLPKEAKEGQVVYLNTDKTPYIYDGTEWKPYGTSSDNDTDFECYWDEEPVRTEIEEEGNNKTYKFYLDLVKIRGEGPDISMFPERSELDNYTKKDYAESTYAKKTEIPSITNLATKEEVDNTYAKKTEIPSITNLATKEEVDNTYAKKEQIDPYNLQAIIGTDFTFKAPPTVNDEDLPNRVKGNVLQYRQIPSGDMSPLGGDTWCHSIIMSRNYDTKQDNINNNENNYACQLAFSLLGAPGAWYRHIPPNGEYGSWEKFVFENSLLKVYKLDNILTQLPGGRESFKPEDRVIYDAKVSGLLPYTTNPSPIGIRMSNSEANNYYKYQWEIRCTAGDTLNPIIQVPSGWWVVGDNTATVNQKLIIAGCAGVVVITKVN